LFASSHFKTETLINKTDLFMNFHIQYQAQASPNVVFVSRLHICINISFMTRNLNPCYVLIELNSPVHTCTKYVCMILSRCIKHQYYFHYIKFFGAYVLFQPSPESLCYLSNNSFVFIVEKTDIHCSTYSTIGFCGLLE